jgi:hypothetical protein
MQAGDADGTFGSCVVEDDVYETSKQAKLKKLVETSHAR